MKTRSIRRAHSPVMDSKAPTSTQISASAVWAMGISGAVGRALSSRLVPTRIRSAFFLIGASTRASAIAAAADGASSTATRLKTKPAYSGSSPLQAGFELLMRLC